MEKTVDASQRPVQGFQANTCEGSIRHSYMRNFDGQQTGSYIRASERARHAVLSCHLQRSYLIYCTGCALVIGFLLCWNLIQGLQSNWDLQSWRYYMWEETLEVLVGVCLVVETLITLWILGPRSFFKSCWCIFDLCVTTLAAMSMVVGALHLEERMRFHKAVPLLMMRFVLQPLRVLVICGSIYRARRFQHDVDELSVDFNSLSSSMTRTSVSA